MLKMLLESISVDLSTPIIQTVGNGFSTESTDQVLLRVKATLLDGEPWNKSWIPEDNNEISKYKPTVKVCNNHFSKLLHFIVITSAHKNEN